MHELVVLAALVMTVAACNPPAPQLEAVTVQSDRGVKPAMTGLISEDPAVIPKRYRNLDEYLAHLEAANGPVGKSWYRQVRPGVFELQTGNLRVLGADGTEAKQTFTREELERKFGFRR